MQRLPTFDGPRPVDRFRPHKRCSEDWGKLNFCATGGTVALLASVTVPQIGANEAELSRKQNDDLRQSASMRTRE